VPSQGDAILIPDLGVDAGTTNDLAISFDSITMHSSRTFWIRGNPLVLTGAVPISQNPIVNDIHDDSTLDLDTNVTVTHPQPRIEVIGAGTLSFTQFHTLTVGGAVEFHLENAYTVGVFATLMESSPSSLRLTGNGSIAFLGAGSNLSGEVYSELASLSIGNDTALGTSSAKISVPNTSELVTFTSPPYSSVPAPYTLRRSFEFRAVGAPDDLTLTFSGLIEGPVALLGAVNVTPSGDVNAAIVSGSHFDGVVSGPGALGILGSLILTNPANSFTGPITIKGRYAGLINGASEVIPNGNTVNVSDGGTYDVQSYTETIDTFNCSSTFRAVVGAGVLRVTHGASINACTFQMDQDVLPGVPGSSATLVANATNRPLGEFVGLPEGGVVGVPYLGSLMSITYRGGGGGDIVMTRLARPQPTTRIAAASIAVQSTPFNSAVQSPFSVEALDASGVVTPGTWIKFEVLTAGCGQFQGGVTAVGRQTTIAGHATAPAFTVSNSTTACVVRASVFDGSLISVTPSPPDIYLDFIVNPYNPASGAPPFTMSTSLQDMWWVGPSENGWGMSLIQHDDTLFGALYIYDANGKPTWLVMPGGTWDAAHLIYSGSLYAPTGSPFYAYDTTHFVAGNAKGTIKITFQDANDAILDYTINGVTGRKFVQREVFADGSATAPNRSDLWWGGSSQNGWGITLLQQASTLFAVWYTYDANGTTTWYVIPGGAWTATDTYEGHLYRTTGSPWVGATYNPASLQVFDAGTFKFQFNGDTASFTYTADGHTGTVPLVKEPF
jgi:hypothetical protein